MGEGVSNGGSSSGEKPASYEELTNMLGSSDAGSDQKGLDTTCFRADAKILRARLRRRSLGLVNPTSRFMMWWDLFVLFAITFTAIVTPFEVALIPYIVKPPNALAIINIVVTVVFSLDIVLQFFLPFRAPAKQGGGMVRSHKRIARAYITRWFLIDVASVLPLEGFGGLRLLRLLKLARVLRLSRILARWEGRISLSSTAKEGVFYMLLVLFTLHWVACAWSFLATGSLRTPQLQDAVALRMASDVTCDGCTPDGAAASPVAAACTNDCLTDCEAEVLAGLRGERVAFVRSQEHWICRAALSDGTLSTDSGLGADASVAAIFERWVFAMLVAMAQMSGGAIVIGPTNISEYILFFFGLLGGSVIWAMVQGVIVGVITNGDPALIEHRQKMDALNFLMADMSISKDVRVRVREYYRQTLQLLKRQSYGELIDLLSPQLATDLHYQMGSWVVQCVWWLRNLDKSLLRAIFVRMQRVAFAAREKIEADRLNVLCHGVVAHVGQIKTATEGFVWGDILVSCLALRNKAAARALTYVEVVTLTREDLDAALSEHPDAAARLRQSAMIEALSKATEMIAKAVQAQKERKRLENASEDEREAARVRSKMGDVFGGGGGGETVEIAEGEDILHQLSSMGVLPTWREVGANGQIVAGPPAVAPLMAAGGGGRSSGRSSGEGGFVDEPLRASVADLSRRMGGLEATMHEMLQHLRAGASTERPPPKSPYGSPLGRAQALPVPASPPMQHQQQLLPMWSRSDLAPPPAGATPASANEDAGGKLSC